MNQDLSKSSTWIEQSDDTNDIHNIIEHKPDEPNQNQYRRSNVKQLVDSVDADDVENALSDWLNDLSCDRPLPMFDIISTVTVSEPDNIDKKYVLYTVRVRHGSARADLHSTCIERRYTDFLNLYDGLRKYHPDRISTYSFPRKAIMGNFSITLIKERSKKFEELLQLVEHDSKLRTTSVLLHFLQEQELNRVNELFEKKDFHIAEPILKNSFRLLNKVFTDRSAPVLLALCRLVGCYAMMPGVLHKSAERWATLALHRFEAVSDSDLLSLYGPLLETCLTMWQRNQLNSEFISERLNNMKRRGIMLQDKDLLDAVYDLDRHYRDLPTPYGNI